ncbi:MAG: EF-hand protein, partial [Alphaproteobacteria bacterium]|nr:EF-hand protein [Alphaproteobacteria bacterium]
MRTTYLLPALVLVAGCVSAPEPGHRRMGPGAGPERHRSFFMSPMGEPFRNNGSGAPPEGVWFANADANRDGAISLAEMEADASRFFATLDVNGDGEIDPAEITRYEEEIAPELHQLNRFRGGGARAAARSGGGMGRGGGGG